MATQKPQAADQDLRLRTPPRSAASIKKVPDVPADKIDRRVDRNHRPLSGTDVFDFVTRNKLERIEAVSLLALASPGNYQKLVDTKESLPMDVELLMRLYMEEPPRPKLRPIEVFNQIYGSLLEKFKFSDAYEPAKIMLFARFTAMLGRTIYSAYRWLEQNADGSYGQPSGPVRRLLANLPADPTAMRHTLEGLARVTWRARGIDFEEEFPLPDPKNPPVARKTGPVPGTRRSAATEPSPDVATVKLPHVTASDLVIETVKSASKGRVKTAAQTAKKVAVKRAAKGAAKKSTLRKSAK